MKRHLLLTVDYEIFGNGAGDVRRHVTGPTERMSRIAERFEVPITIFFEAEEYLQFEQNSNELRRALGYDPAKEIRHQAKDLVYRGHDIQLHLHPQWHRARLGNNRWLLDDSLTVDALFETEEETIEFIRRRQALLEEISGQPIVAYRAGGFAAQPGTRLLRALSQTGFQLESSVVKGMRHTHPHQLDYRSAPFDKRLWRISTDVTQEDPSGPLWEVPVYSRMGQRWEQLTMTRLKAKFSRNIPLSRQRATVGELELGSTPRSFLSFLFEPVPIKFDYHNLSPAALHKMIQCAPAPPPGDLDVLVLIGHSKEHMNDLAFEALLRRLTADSSLEVVSMRRLAQIVAQSHPSETAAPSAGASRWPS